MSIFQQLAKVRMAQASVDVARRELSIPATALLARGRRYPLIAVGAAAGTGFVLGSVGVRPWRGPSVTSLFGGGLVEMVVAYGMRLVTELELLDGLGFGRGAGSRDSRKQQVDEPSSGGGDSP